VRVAEEWSVVDNLSNGRVAISFASGWHPDDFIFAPAVYEDRKEVMFRHIELIQRLWGGETIMMPGVGGQEVAVRLLPKPLQTRLPIWITSAGSVALPLHHPVRVAEEWSVVDNLSNGRVAVSFASGWHPDDFIFAPAVYEDRKEVMFRHIELIQRLWDGETLMMPGPGDREVPVRLLPKPLQKRLPIWITSAGSAETWIRAGEIGANILAALIGYSFEDLAERIRSYREARARCGHDPRTGIISIMVHTFVGQSNSAVKEQVRAPFTHYLRSYFKQYDNVRVTPEDVTEADRDAIMAAAFEHYFKTNTLMGTPAKCSVVIEQLLAAGVDEVACLVDFGVAADAVLENLEHLNELREHYGK
jgi:natural product biosynthesis luciferase-like monooxygenase protein